MIALSKEWLKINNRITVATIVNSFDYDKSNLINRRLLMPIFERMGIKLHFTEADMIADCIKDVDDDLLRYRPLVIELTTGPNQKEFILP